jgi:tetratricopeptide (TPR) repeat protein
LAQKWRFEALRDGENAEAWSKVAKEIEGFIAQHSNEKTTTYAVGAFITRHLESLPAGFVDHCIEVLDAKGDSKDCLRAQVEFARASRVRDPRQSAQVMQAFVDKYPDSFMAGFAQESCFFGFYELQDLAGAEAAFAKYRDITKGKKDLFTPNTHTIDRAMAQLYVDMGVKLEAAVKLLDDDLQAMRADPRFKMDAEAMTYNEALYAETRARAYVGLHKPELALPQAQKALSVFPKRALAHFVLAQAYSGVGDKRKALDEYFEAALMPSNKDLEYRAELERFYGKNFGSAKQFQTELNKRIAERFSAANYVPKLLNQSAPPLEFTTTKGEKFDAAALSRKTVIINFWSPG